MLPAAQFVALFSLARPPPFPARNSPRKIPTPALRFAILMSGINPWPLPQEARMTDISRRHSGRITKSTPIILLGCDAEGRVFSEETRTVILSFHGAGILSAHKLVSEQEMTLRSLVTLREAEIRVIGEIAKQDDFHVYG